MDMIKYILLLLLMPFTSICLAQDGLLFKSHQVSKEARTSASVGSEDGIRFRKYVNLTFKYKIYDNPSGSFGPICKIVIGDTQTIDLKLNVKYRSGMFITFLLNGKTITERPIRRSTGDLQVWQTMSCSVFPDERRICIQHNSDSLSVPISEINDRNIKVYFGAESHFSARDVASFILGDVSLSLKPGYPKHLWKMDGPYDTVIPDNIGNIDMFVENPEWLANAYMHWKKEFSCEFPEFHLAENRCDKAYIVTDSTVYTYYLDLNKLDKCDNLTPFKAAMTSNHFFWNDTMSRLEYFFATDTTVTLSYFDPDRCVWDPMVVPDGKWNMKGNILEAEGKYIQAFGYGYHKYSDDIFVKEHGIVRKLNDSLYILPRYLSSVGVYGNDLIVMSGIGNARGSQLAGSRIYADMFRVNIDSGNIEKIEGLDIPENEVAINNMLCIDDSLSFYTLFYPPFQDNSFLVLKKIDIRDKFIESYADTITYKFHDVASDARLCYSSESRKFYAVTKEKVSGGRFAFNVYSIRYPVQELKLQNKRYHLSPLSYIIISIFLSLLAISVYVICRKYRYRLRTPEGEDTKTFTEEIVVDFPESALIDGAEESAEGKERLPGVYLLNGFRVIDRNGADITSGFTPVMKQLLGLIILYTLKDERGVSNSVLKENLWPDKSDESAVNNRSVNLRKIRKQLSEVGEYEISSRNSYWHITFSDTFRCDLSEAKDVIERIKGEKHGLKRDDISDMLRISSYGVLLPNQQNDFFDEFKADYASSVIDALNMCLKYCDEASVRVSLSNAIFTFSPLDESALRVKCKALLAMGKNGLAKQTFDTFIRNYREMMGEDFQYSMDYVINHQEF